MPPTDTVARGTEESPKQSFAKQRKDPLILVKGYLSKSSLFVIALVWPVVIRPTRATSSTNFPSSLFGAPQEDCKPPDFQLTLGGEAREGDKTEDQNACEQALNEVHRMLGE